MAINIQEILHPSDSNQIKWEKVNYNFDQILANGGGPVGQKGQRGTQGSVGQTGAKGEKGDQGIKGESGSTSSRWETITVDIDPQDGIADYVILKPKLESDTYHPVIFLGDQTFDNVNGNPGLTNLRSTFTLGKHAQGGDSPSDEYLTFWHGERPESGNNIAITLSSNPNDQSETDDDGNPFTRFQLAELYGSSAAETIEFNIALDRISLGKLGSSSDTYFAGAEASFILPPTNRALNTIKPGSVRYFGNEFQGAILDSNNNLVWTPFCMSPCGGGGYTGTIELDDNSDINVAWDGSLLNASIEIQDDSDINVDVNGNPWNGTTTSTTSTTTSPPAETINIAQVSYDPTTTLSHVGGNASSPMYIRYETSPTQLLLSTNEVSHPSWVNVTSTSGGSGNDRVLFWVSENNTGSTRNGVLSVAHPNDPGATDSISISQSAAPATTTTTTTTTTTPAPPSYSSISANPSGTVDEGQQVTVTVTGNNIVDGTRVWVNMNLGDADQSDVTSGWSSGAGSGDSPSNSSWGNWVTMNSNTGSHTITLKNDVALEGTETIIFSLLSYDEAGTATGSLQTSVDINDTSYPLTYTVTFINGNYSEYSTCQLTNNTKTATYDAPEVGLAPWNTISTAIVNDDDYTGSSGVWFKVVSSTEPGFLHGNKIANGAAPHYGGTDCSTVTTTTTTTTTDSGDGSGCGVYYLGNTNSMYPVSLQGNYGCGGEYISINSVGASYQTSNNVFCSDQPMSVLQMNINHGLGTGFVSAGTGTGCAPGGSWPGAS